MPISIDLAASAGFGVLGPAPNSPFSAYTGTDLHGRLVAENAPADSRVTVRQNFALPVSNDRPPLVDIVSKL